MRKKIITSIIFFVFIAFLISGFLIKKKKVEPEEIELKKEDIYSETASPPSQVPVSEKSEIKKEDYILGKEGLPILVVSNFRAGNIDPAVINIISDKLQFDILKNGKFRIIDRISLPKLFDEQNIKIPKDYESLKSYCEKLKKINVNYLISGNLNNYDNTFSLDLLQVNVSNCEIEQIVNVIAKENPSNLIREIDNAAIKFEPVTIKNIKTPEKEKSKEVEKKPSEEISLKETPIPTRMPVLPEAKPTPETTTVAVAPEKISAQTEIKPTTETSPEETTPKAITTEPIPQVTKEATPVTTPTEKPTIVATPEPTPKLTPVETVQTPSESKELKPTETIKPTEPDLSSVNSQLIELSKRIESIEKKLDENIQLSKSLDQTMKKNQDEVEKLKLKLNEISKEQIDVSEGIPADQLYQEALKFPDGSMERANKLLQAIKQDPNNIIYRQKLARTYYSLKDYDNAIKQCDAAIKINPNDPYNYTLKGTTLFEKGEYKDAAILHEKAILLDSTYSSAYYNLALTYEKIDKNLALKKWEEYLHIAQDDPTQQDWIPIAKKRMEKLKVEIESSK